MTKGQIALLLEVKTYLIKSDSVNALDIVNNLIEGEAVYTQAQRDFELATMAAEFGYKGHEKGWNLQYMLAELRKLQKG